LPFVRSGLTRGYEQQQKEFIMLSDILIKQDASDVFFNLEGICQAYENSDGTLEDFANYIFDDSGLSLSKEEATVIAKDFLGRL